jgi:L-ascorbate metabolism protein UlaG (beta-lactamase superfamily)
MPEGEFFIMKNIRKPSRIMTAYDFCNTGSTTIYWLSGAGFLINCHGTCILIDPVLMTASGCGRRENADKEDNNITIYKSNENADGFDTETVSLDALTPENIMAALIDAGVVPSDVKVLDFKQEEDTITLDLSKTFEEYVNQMGTAGEYATVGSVVNTYLDAYDAKAVSLLVEGGTWSTGHAEYETLQGRYTYDAQE